MRSEGGGQDLILELDGGTTSVCIVAQKQTGFLKPGAISIQSNDLISEGANINQRQRACNSCQRVQPVNCNEMVFQVLKLSHRLKVMDLEEDEKRRTMKLRLSK
ncbi:hypothetical protein Tco_1578090 [Tanacetum coccineum]